MMEERVSAGLDVFDHDFPSGCSENYRYGHINTGGWEEGFWMGMLYYTWLLTGEEKFRRTAQGLLGIFDEMVKEPLDTHDIGFLYSLSTVADYKLTGSEEQRKVSLKAADALCKRFHEKVGFLQAWLEMGNEKENRFIVDCFMNLPLLFWAYEQTGNEKYRRIGQRHFETAYQYLLREDGSSNHTFFMDTATGEPLYARTHQGKSDTSCWSRGQGWIIYGPTLVYGYVKDNAILENVKKSANYFLNRLPEDLVPYWDFEAEEGDPRDSSAASLAVCGLLELSQCLGAEGEIYKNAADAIMESLIDHYLNLQYPEQVGLLLHATQSLPHHWGVDEFNIWVITFL